MFDRNFAATGNLREVRNVARRSQVRKQVIRDSNIPGRLAWILIVLSEHIHAVAGVSRPIVCDLHILNRAPGRFAILISDRNDEGGLSWGSTFQNVAIHHDATSVLQFKCPLHRNLSRPLSRPVEVVTTNLNIRWNQIGYGRICAAKQNDLSASFEIVIDNVKRSWSIPTRDRLRLIAFTGKAGDV